MSADVFIDSNILVYAHDKDAGEKHDKAKALDNFLRKALRTNNTGGYHSGIHLL